MEATHSVKPPPPPQACTQCHMGQTVSVKCVLAFPEIDAQTCSFKAPEDRAVMPLPLFGSKAG